MGRRSRDFETVMPVPKSVNAAEEHGLLESHAEFAFEVLTALAACPSCCPFLVCVVAAIAKWFVRLCALFSFQTMELYLSCASVTENTKRLM